MDYLTLLQIDMEANKLANSPDIEDYKDAIVEVFADTRHLTDEEVDMLFFELCLAKATMNTQVRDLLDMIHG